MSYRYSYGRPYRGKRLYRVMDRTRGAGKKEKIVFLLLFLALFMAIILLSPVSGRISAAWGKESIEAIPAMLLAYSIPGMDLKGDFGSGHRANLSENISNMAVPSGIPASVEPHADSTEGASFVPLKRSVSGEDEDIFIAVSREGEASLEGVAPKVLIYHTHTTESFVPFSGETFSNNMEKTVVALGKYLKKTLEEEYGIPVLHYCEVFDIPRRSAYEKARPSVEEVLAEHPSVRVVLDLHRDGVARSITTANIGGQDMGRILFVLGSGHPGWNNNLRFALFLQDALEEVCPGLSRGIRKQPFTYNQHLHQRSLIVEIGGHENSMAEVRRAVPRLAKALASVMP